MGTHRDGETCWIMSAPHLEIGSNSCFSCFRTLDDIEIYIYIKIPSFLLILAKHCHCLLCCLCLSGCQVDRKLLDLGFHLDTFRALLACRNWEESNQQPSIQGVKILKIQQISWYNHTVQFWICIQWYYECLVLRFSPVLNSLTAYADVWSRTVWF